jgi:penicillin amidase
MGFDSDSTVNAEVYFGPSMRRIIDFSNVEESFSVLPTGQSGYFFAPHYQDQFELFNQNMYRRQWMRKSEITKQAGSPLRLKPAP